MRAIEPLTPRSVIACLHEQWSWRQYPEARADFLAFVIGQQADEDGIRLQWTAFVYGWVAHKQYLIERRGLTSAQANVKEVEQFAERAQLKPS